MRLLLVEDDEMLGQSLRKSLGYEGYTVDWMRDGEAGLAAARSGDFDVLVLDGRLPGISGFDVLKCIRNESSEQVRGLPVLMLSALGQLESRVAGLDSGADDYLTKPFHVDELNARLRALVRRPRSQPLLQLVCRDFTLDLNAHSALTPDGNVHALSAQEFKLLHVLARQPGRLVSKCDLEEEVYGWEGEADSNTIEVVVYNLRRKLGKAAIITVRGLGYMVTK